jgi:hypothetical protein
MMIFKTYLKMAYFPGKTLFFLLLSICLSAGTLQVVRGQGASLGITGTKLVDFKGWGIMPAPIDRQTPTFNDGSIAYSDASWLPASGTTPNALHQRMGELSFDIARVYISPTIGKSDNTLDLARLQDLKDHLTILQNQGIPDYIITVWSPPVHMKSPNQVRYGSYNNTPQTLNPQYADGAGYDYADFLVAVVLNLKNAGFKLPLNISIQNEPGVAGVYDGCVYENTEANRQMYRNVCKQLRAKLNQNNLGSIQVVGPEPGGLNSLPDILGTASSTGFSNLNADADFKNAIGAFAFHTYYTSGSTRTLLDAMAAYPTKDRWMTEYSTADGIRTELRPNSGSAQQDWALNFARRMAGDLVDLRSNYWFFWRGWHPSSVADDQDLLYGDSNAPGLSKAYYVFQKLWQTTGPGWRVMAMTSDDPQLRTDNTALINSGSGDQWSAPVNLLAMENAAGSQSCLMIVNHYSTAKTLKSVTGLKGDNARVFVSDLTSNMAEKTARTVAGGTLAGGDLVVPAYSVTFVISTTTATNANLALNKSVVASSMESANLPATAAVDGNYATRWSSAYSNAQSIYVNLGSRYNVNRVKITWEAAYGKDYRIEFSNDAIGWTTARSVTGNTTLVNDLTGLSGTAQYVRMQGVTRGTVYGYSIYELEVYGSPAATGAREAVAGSGGSSRPLNLYPNPATAIVHAEGLEDGTPVQILAANGSGLVFHQRARGRTIDVARMPAGLYVVCFNAEGRPVRHKLIRK